MKINLGKMLELPIEIVTMKQAFMGGNGSGKTFAAKKEIEGILDAGGWVITIDPAGIHYGIRLDADGKKPSRFKIPVFGGLYGDVSLTPESGELIADVLCDKRISAVLDLSLFEDPEVNRFMTDFGKRFFMRMKRNPKAVTVVLEECQEFIPQNPMKGEEKKLHVWNKIVKIGRQHGIGVIMISPRPQDVNKKSLNMAQVMFAFQLAGSQERKAIAEWFSYQGNNKFDIEKELPILSIGTAILSIPRMKIGEIVKIGRITTYDSSATPDFEASKSENSVTLKPIDISNLEEKMKGLIEEKKLSDPEFLKKELAEAKKTIANLSKQKPVETIKTVTVEKIVQVPILTQEEINQLNAILRRISTAKVSGPVSTPITGAKKPIEISILSTPNIKTHVPYVETAKKGDSEASLPRGEKAVLQCVAQFGSRTRKQIRIITGYKKSSVDTYIRNLVSYGYVVANDSIEITEAGLQACQDAEQLPSGRDLIEYWKNTLSGGERELFIGIVSVYPNDVHRDQIPSEVQYAPSSVDTYLRKLISYNIVYVSRKGYVKADDELFKD